MIDVSTIKKAADLLDKADVPQTNRYAHDGDQLIYIDKKGNIIDVSNNTED